MTPERRAEILSKDVITIKELGELLNLGYQMAAQKMRDMRRGLQAEGRDKLNIRGKVLVEDYAYYYGLNLNRNS